MATVELIKIFLASPGDVQTERRYAKEVVATINSTVAQDKNIRLEIKCSENTHPGYGKDGQAIINEQIGKMGEYGIFILIMKDRFGSPTKRHSSGTVEEFTLARKAHEQTGQPDIWFYSGPMKQDIKNKEDKQQQAKVKGFKTRFINNRYGLFKNYKNPADFKKQLDDQLTLWLNNYSNKKTRKSSTTPKNKTVSPKKKELVNKTKVVKNSNQVSLTSSKPPKEPKPGVQKTQITSKSENNNGKSITNSGAWILLDDNLFKTKSVSQDINNNFILNIPIVNAEQEAHLNNLQSKYTYGSRSVPYSYQNHASMVEVQSVKTDSINGKTSYIVTVKPMKQSNNLSFGYNGYSSEQVAEIKIRALLLDELPPNQNTGSNLVTNSLLYGIRSSGKPEKFNFRHIWQSWKNKPEMFLVYARLSAVYHLKINNIVEHILKFKISLNKNVVSVDFSGNIKNTYTNQDSNTVEIKGKCTL